MRYRYNIIKHWRWVCGLALALLLTIITLSDTFFNSGAASAEASTDAYYRFKPGETVEGVAFRFGLAPRTIICANPTYKPGDARINLPLTSARRQVVQAGQSLGEIARIYQVEIPVITRFPLNYWPGCPGFASFGAEKAETILPAGTLLYVPGSPVLPKDKALVGMGQLGGKLAILPPTVAAAEVVAVSVSPIASSTATPAPIASSTEISGPPPTVGTAVEITPVPSQNPPGVIGAPAQATPILNKELIWPIRGKITTYFSAIHPGLDVSTAEGTMVVAAQSGFVYFAAWSPYGYGNFVQLEHGDGRQTHYAHLRLMTVKYGDFVQQGQVIGYEGSTGNSTGPHLHFELVVEGKYVNPLEYLK